MLWQQTVFWTSTNHIKSEVFFNHGNNRKYSINWDLELGQFLRKYAMKFCMSRNKCTDLEEAMHWGKWEVGKYGYYHPTYADLTLGCTLACTHAYIHTYTAQQYHFHSSSPENMYAQIHTCVWW